MATQRSGIWAEYDPDTKVMTVHFRNGTYKLPNVPIYVWNGFNAHASKGTYWNKYLKGKY